MEWNCRLARPTVTKKHNEHNMAGVPDTLKIDHADLGTHDWVSQSYKKQPGLDQCHRDKNVEISKKHGNTLFSTLRISR